MQKQSNSPKVVTKPKMRVDKNMLLEVIPQPLKKKTTTPMKKGDPKQKKEEDEVELSAVIVTIFQETSYDAIFRETAQESEEGTRVAVFNSGYNVLSAITKELKKLPMPIRVEDSDSEDDEIGEQMATMMLRQISETEGSDSKTTTTTTTTTTATATTATTTTTTKEQNKEVVEYGPPLLKDWKKCLILLMKEVSTLSSDGKPGAVVFNFECCAGCSSAFPQKNAVFELVEQCLLRGHMVMCSDFSMKCLIDQWPKEKLGPNPFTRNNLGFNGRLQLHFVPSVIKRCPSSQLQKVGKLCANGTASVHAMSGTIDYTLTTKAQELAYSGTSVGGATSTNYQIQLLSVVKRKKGQVTDCCVGKGSKKAIMTEVGTTTCLSAPILALIGDYLPDLKQAGAAGHVLLTYPSGGQLLTSCTHWVELQKLDGVSERALLKMAMMDYGETEAEEMMSDMSLGMYKGQKMCREEVMQNYAKKYVKSSAPSKMRKKKKMMKKSKAKSKW